MEASWSIVLGCLLLATSLQAQAINVQSAAIYTYKVTQRLQLLGRPYAYLPSISWQGAVAGTLSNEGKTSEVAVWYNNRYTKLGTGSALAINDYALIAGEIPVLSKADILVLFLVQ